MKQLELLRARIATMLAERDAQLDEAEALASAAIDETRSLTIDEETRSGELLAKVRELDTEIEAARAREAELVEIEARSAATSGRPGLNVIRSAREVAPTDVTYMLPGAARDAAMAAIERAADYLNDGNRAHLERSLRRNTGRFQGDQIARRILLTENEHYRSAWAKAMLSPTPAWTSDEARAMQAFRDHERAMSHTSAAGGYGVPVFIDPTIIITSGAADNPIMRVARVENITTDTWKGVSSAGSTWSWDAEAAEVSDDSPTLAQPTVSIYTARGFVPFSIEIDMDYPSFAAEMAGVLDQGYMDLTVAAFTTGTGSSQPFGIFTALDANTNVEVVVTTDGAFGAVDVDKVWKSLPERYRRTATWLMNVDVENEIRAFGSGTATSRFTVDQTAEGILLLNGRPVMTSDYAPEFTGTTGASNILVLGDFRHFLVAQRAGMSTELVPHLMGVTNGRPLMQRGILAYARIGSDSVNDNGFRLLQNQ